MVGLVPTIHVFAGRRSCSRRGCSLQGRAWRAGKPPCPWAGSAAARCPGM